MKRPTATVILLLIAVAPSLAHEGGGHKSTKGTVQSVDDRQIVVRTVEGKEQTILLDNDTDCRDRQGDARCSDVKTGDRVVVIIRTKGEQTIADKVTFAHVVGKSTEDPAGDH